MMGIVVPRNMLSKQ